MAMRRAGEARTDVGGEVGSGGAVGKFTDGAVGKRDAHRALRLDHGHAHALRGRVAVGAGEFERSFCLPRLAFAGTLNENEVAPASSVSVLDLVLPRVSVASVSAELPSTTFSSAVAARRTSPA